DFRARDLGLDLNPGANIHVFPVISGFLGGDTVAAILAEQPHHQDEVLLIIDIGTNGELVLGNRKALWATSCATGPAFEGAHISRGMRAAPGAIHKVDIDPEALRPFYEVLGDHGKVQPQGICGSGIIDAVAAMRRTGLLRPNGRLVEGMPGEFADGGRIGQRFVLATAEDSRPEIANIKVAENAAGMGAILALLDRKRRLEAMELSGMVRFVELAEAPDFQREYILGMDFPDPENPKIRGTG